MRERGGSNIDPAVQRYVIAWAERKRALHVVEQATLAMAVERKAVEAASQDHPRRAELLDGSVYFVVMGERGIQVTEAKAR